MEMEARLGEGYRAAREGAAFRPLPDAGYVRVGGEDRTDFMQRQTTNDVRLLGSGKALVNVLASPTARILHAFTMLQEPEHLALVTVAGGEALAAYLRGKIFFMDKVTVEDASAEFSQFDLDGPQAGDLLTQIGLERAPGEGERADAHVGGAPLTVFGRKGLAGVGYWLLAPTGHGADVERALLDAGAVPLGEEAYDVLRVEAGLPAPGAELTEDFTPLETGLAYTVSTSKGCYTGQEVLARQINYDKVSRQLVGLRLKEPAPAGSAVRAEGRPAGTVTSVARSPEHGWIALAVVKRPHHEPGSSVAVQTASGEVGATVSALPFSAT